MSSSEKIFSMSVVSILSAIVFSLWALLLAKIVNSDINFFLWYFGHGFDISMCIIEGIYITSLFYFLRFDYCNPRYRFINSYTLLAVIIAAFCVLNVTTIYYGAKFAAYPDL